MSARHDADAPVIPNAALRAHAQRLLQGLDNQKARFVLWDQSKGEPIELTEELFELLRCVLIDLAQNRAVQLLPLNLEMTTVQAAEYLNVSRPHVIKLVADGKLPCRMVGTHRRLRLDDLMAFQRAAGAEAAKVRDEMTREAEEIGWEY